MKSVSGDVIPFFLEPELELYRYSDELELELLEIGSTVEPAPALELVPSLDPTPPRELDPPLWKNSFVLTEIAPFYTHSGITYDKIQTYIRAT